MLPRFVFHLRKGIMPLPSLWVCLALDEKREGCEGQAGWLFPEAIRSYCYMCWAASANPGLLEFIEEQDRAKTAGIHVVSLSFLLCRIAYLA
jgi:hypothetical protein